MSRRMSGRPSSTILSNFLDPHLNLYSISAIAAGVGLLAVVAPAEGKVVVTHKTIQIPANHPISIDLNHDGISDFQFSLRSDLSACGGYGSLLTKQALGNAVVGGSGNFASALTRGAKIGPSARFTGSVGYTRIENSNVEYCSGSSRHSVGGYWGGNPPPNRYMGVKFRVHGTTHFGWIRLSFNFPAKLGGGPPSATITGYAYETVANKTIIAGNTSTPAIEAVTQQSAKPAQPSLGMLALGADSLPLWRREETSVRQ
jgi:hypothetical protein